MPLSPTGAFADRHDLLTDSPANPGAGNNLAWAVPVNRVVQVVGLRFLLTTSAVVAERVPVVVLDNGVALQVPLSPGQAQAENLAFTRHFAVGVAASNLSADSILVDPLACCYQLKVGEQLEIQILNIDAGDTITAAAIRFFSWTED